jgi:bifunctional N-acetylglucosamine-1-phosphate-uridyltransferase/glucosamine-1-phosphate-acetyltransferase GlmU-like protein
MPKGKPWTIGEERKLRELRSENLRVSEIAVVMGKSEQAILKKLQRMGLKVVQQQKSSGTTTSELILPEELPSVEEALVMLAGAMNALRTPGLSKTEVTRLRGLIQAASLYQVKFAEYVDYRGTEKHLVELSRKFEELAKRGRVEEDGV